MLHRGVGYLGGGLGGRSGSGEAKGSLDVGLGGLGGGIRSRLEGSLTGKVGSKLPISTWAAIKLSMQMRLILIRGSLIKRRTYDFPFSRHRQVMSYSDICGHLSFMCLAASYLATDITYLRMSAVTGITLSIVFQYYREAPLWIPIRWNFIFLLTNIVLLIALFKEANDADNLPEEQKQLYVNVFKDVGNMKMADALHLMMIANRKCYSEGIPVISRGKNRKHLFIILKGKCKVVNKDGETVSELGPNQFISEKSFAAWKAKYGEKRAESFKGSKKVSIRQMVMDAAKSLMKGSDTEAANVDYGNLAIVANIPDRDFTNNDGVDDSFMLNTVDTTNQEQSTTEWVTAVHEAITSWLFPVNDTGMQDDEDDSQSNDTADNSVDKAPDEGKESKTDAKKNKNRKGWDLIGLNDVIVEEDLVVYCWRFDVLHDMILKWPEI